METGKFNKGSVAGNILDVFRQKTDVTRAVRNSTRVAAIALLVSGCTLDRDGSAAFPAGHCDDPYDCNTGQDSGVDQDGQVEADAFEWPDSNTGGSGGTGGTGSTGGTGGGIGGFSGTGGSNDAGTDVDAAEDAPSDVIEDSKTEAEADVEVDAPIDAPVDSPVESGPDGGPTTCIGTYDATITGPSQVVFNAGLGVCSKAYLIDNGTIIQGSDTTTCESGTLLLTGVMAGQTAALFTKTWQYSTQPAELDVEVSLPVTAISISCLEENIPTSQTVGYADALDAVNNLTYVNGYCTGSETDPMIKTSNVDCPEPYITAVILELNQQ